jgi:TRAP-type mannitol/chloroaromatic compound transport system permease small subunit
VSERAPGWLRPLLTFQRGVDWLNERVGAATKYLVVAVVLVGFFNALLRYIGKFTGQQLTSNRYFELQWYLYATIFLLAFGYILKNGINVRVDFWFADRSERTKAIIDAVGHLIALLPFCLLALSVVWGPVLTSWGARPDGSFTTWQVWEIWERSPDPSGLPRAPVKTLLVIGFGLLLLQALAEMIKLVAELTGHGRYARRDAQGSLRVE